MNTVTLIQPTADPRRVRARRFRRGVGVLIALAIGFGTWWWVTLDDLPDVGDPFDVRAALRPLEVPVVENAYSSYVLAHRKLARQPQGFGNVSGEWSEASLEQRSYVIANREALALWREGTERPKALYHQRRDANLGTLLPVTQDLNTFTSMALLEASRLEGEGDMAGAWGWYRASLRAARHSSQGVLVERNFGARTHGLVVPRLTRWAADPRVGYPLLKDALREVIAIDAMTPPLSETLKSEYLMRLRDLSEMKFLVEDVPTPFAPIDWYRQRPVLSQLGGFLQRTKVAAYNDSERSRRIFRLVYANWLAQCDKSPKQRAPVAVRDPVTLYAPDPSAPFAARAVAPERLAQALKKSLLAKLACDQHLEARLWENDGPLARERTRQEALVAALKEQLHRREQSRSDTPQGPSR
jgi:hypothetical protein